MGTDEQTPYERLGGEQAIIKLVDAFYTRILADPELAPFFEHAPMDKLRSMQKEFFSEALGGPPIFAGRSLREVHAGRGIKKSHLRIFTGHLMDTLQAEAESLKLTNTDINAIYSRVALVADEISDDTTEAG